MNAMDYETAYGAAMLELAKKEGHRPCFPGKQDRPLALMECQPTKQATPQTVAIMRLLSQGDASTAELAEATGLTADGAGNRLRSLWRGGFVDIVGEKLNGTKVSKVWRFGPRGDSWLARYGVNGRTA